jgi:hypothetical protein
MVVLAAAAAGVGPAVVLANNPPAAAEGISVAVVPALLLEAMFGLLLLLVVPAKMVGLAMLAKPMPEAAFAKLKGPEVDGAELLAPDPADDAPRPKEAKIFGVEAGTAELAAGAAAACFAAAGAGELAGAATEPFAAAAAPAWPRAAVILDAACICCLVGMGGKDADEDFAAG